jgi:DNA-binding transcriptional regulator LsrR (DeoR family)
MPDNYYEKLIQAALLYYSEGLTQQEAAKKMGTSRQAVCRYLSEAREKKIIEFNIRNPVENNKKLEKRIKEKYKLKSVTIAAGDYYNDEVIRYLIAQRGVEVLKPLLTREYKRVALSWGRAIYTLVNQFPEEEVISDCEVLPLLGATDNAAPYFMINEIVRVFASKIHGSPRFIYLPVSPVDFEDYSHYIRTSAYKSALKYWENIDLAVIGIGDMTGNSLNRTFYPGEDTVLKDFAGNNIVGDLCTKYFDAEGKFHSDAHGKMLLSIPLECLKKVKRVLALAGGASKARSIKGALLTHIIDDLVTDGQTAAFLAKD